MAEIAALGEVLVEIMRPRAGMPLDVPGTFEGPFMSGAPAIFAGACARLGLVASLLGTIGDDAFGHLIRRQAGRDRLDLTYLRSAPSRATACAFVAYAEDGSRDFVFHVGDAAAGVVDPAWPPAGFLDGVRWLHVCGSTLAASDAWREVALRAAQQARRSGAHVSFDPNVRPELLGGRSVADVCGPMLRVANVVLPSGAEAAMLTGETSPEAGCTRLLEAGADLVVLKRGARGAVAYTLEQRVEARAFPIEEIDPTGAGDVFAAALAHGLLADTPLPVALSRACAAGALAVTRRGPLEGAPTREELDAFLARHGARADES